ncbi:MAG: glycerol-3-phosphate dehydrogenase/oxidase [Verrucomicrobiota bacterium]
MNREIALARFGDPGERWDVIVIGGGATGLGIAVDAASRGLRTALLEQADFSESTSSKSTKLVHGGVRYLRGGEVGLVRESLRERGRLLRNAPGFVSPLRFIVPAYRRYEPFFYGAGLTLYDLLAGELGIGSTRHLSDRETLREIPNLRREGLFGGTAYWDCQFDDAGLAVAMARTATSHGAAVVNHIKVEELVKEGGKVCGVAARDVLSEQSFRLHGKTVISAAGVFTDEVRKLDSDSGGELIVPSQGIHLVLDLDFLGDETAIMIPNTDDGRVLFAIPWMGKLVLGTTDTSGVPVALNPNPLEEEIDYLIEHAGRYLQRAPHHKDIRATFAGLRPLVRPSGAGSGPSSRISRSHYLSVTDSGLVVMAGGKWTTYRQMAEDAVDCAIESSSLDQTPCQTHELELDGIEQGAPGEKLDPRLPYSIGDVRNAIEEGMAMRLDDVVSRRLRASFLDEEATGAILGRVAREMADSLGKGEDWIEKEIAEFRSKHPPRS